MKVKNIFVDSQVVIKVSYQVIERRKMKNVF